MSTPYNSETVFSPWLTPVRLVQTSNLAGTYFNGPTNNGVGATLTIAASSLTVDSVVANLYDRILLTAQTSGFQNGIYVVESIGATVVLQRSADFQDQQQMVTGQYVSVKGGTVNAGSFFTLIEPRPQIIGTSNIVFSEEGAATSGVTFSGGPSVANALPVFSNTAGDIKPQTTTATLGFGLAAATGNIQATAGNVIAGSSGNAGNLQSFPAGATSGELLFAAVTNSAGNFNTTVSNAASVAQSQVVSIPDSGAATAQFLVKNAALVSGNFVAASGTGGLVVDSGVSSVAAPTVASVTLSAAQVNSMYATPILVVAAPGAGKAIVVTGLAWNFVYGSAAFAAGGVVTLQYGTTNHAGGVLTTTGIAAASVNGVTANSLLTDTQIPVVATSANTVNTGIYISNATQAFTTGTGTTTTLSVFYRVISAT